jgi:DNA invertase Pin-like site-specific DNA recombinase
MRIGYARVSTADQNPDLQEDALQKARRKRRKSSIERGQRGTVFRLSCRLVATEAAG